MAGGVDRGLLRSEIGVLSGIRWISRQAFIAASPGHLEAVELQK